MKMKPILFNTEMVRAILEGRKTVTRRCVKYKYSNTEMQMRTDKYGTSLIEIQKDVEGETFGKNEDGTTWRKLLAYIEKVPPFKVNDILYVRETWCSAYDGAEYFYLADKVTVREKYWLLDYNNVKWRPSIHMPKEAARIFLKVTGVRVERLQDINSKGSFQDHVTNIAREGIKLQAVMENYEKQANDFKALWDSTIKKDQLQYYSWDANPYVWVIEFERCEKPAELEIV